MNQVSWLDTNFYIVSDKIQYTILGEVELDDPIDPELLQRVVEKVFHRFPYFSIRVIVNNGEYQTVPNTRSHKVLCSEGPLVLGSQELNYHLVAVSYYGNRMFFHFSHSITDGIGRMPFTKSVIYYYLTEKYGIDIPSDGIYLADSDLYLDEIGEPLHFKEIRKADGEYYRPIGDACKVSALYQIAEHERRAFRFSVDEAQFIDLCRSLHASPNSLVSVFLAQVLLEKYPQIDQSIVVNLCVNMRPAFHNEHSHLLMLCNIPLHFTSQQSSLSLEELCARTRADIREQTREKNIRYICLKNIQEFEKIRKIRTIEKRHMIAERCIHGKEGFLSPTYTVSYVGKNSMGVLSPYIRSMYTFVDTIPDDGAMIEITSVNGRIFFNYLQDFADAVFAEALAEKIRSFGVEVSDMSCGSVNTPRIHLPEA